MYVAAAGLSPRSPVMEVAPVVEIPVFARMTKLPDPPRLTIAGPAANRACPDGASTNKTATIVLHDFLLNFFIFI
jgi:hypothetical protein